MNPSSFSPLDCPSNFSVRSPKQYWGSPSGIHNFTAFIGEPQPMPVTIAHTILHHQDGYPITYVIGDMSVKFANGTILEYVKTTNNTDARYTYLWQVTCPNGAIVQTNYLNFVFMYCMDSFDYFPSH